MSEPTGLPKGWVKLDMAVYSNGTAVVLTGQPPDEESDPAGEMHNCDAMGCRWEHVMFGADVPAFARPMIAKMVEMKLPKPPPPPQPSLRLAMLARKGKLTPPAAP